MERQRQMTRQRLEEKRRKREEQQYEEDMAASIVTMAEKRNALIREKTMLRREGHKDAVSVELLWIRENSQMKKFYFPRFKLHKINKPENQIGTQFLQQLRKWQIQLRAFSVIKFMHYLELNSLLSGIT